MKIVTTREAKTQLSKLIKRAKAGETIYVGSYGQPEAIIAPIPASPQRQVNFGAWQNNPKLQYRDADLMGSDAEIQNMFYGKK